MEQRPRYSQTILPPVPQSWKESGEDPLVSLVKSMSDTSRGYQFSEGHFLAIATFAQQVDFDPNSLVQTRLGPAKVSSLLSFLLSKVPNDSCKVKVQWPDTLDDFQEMTFPEGVFPHPAEWLGAMLLSKGADPWAKGEVVVGTSRHAGQVAKWGYPSVTAPIFQALRCGMLGLADKMIQMPGAPSIERLAHDPTEWMTLPVRDSAAVNESWLHRVASEEIFIPVLEWFLDKGITPRKESRFHPLEQAHPKALVIFKEKGLLPSDKATQRRLASAWRARAKSQELSANDLTKMVAVLEGRAVNPEEKTASEFMILLTKNAWGSTPSECHRYAYNTGAKKLVQRAEVTTGALSGTWSRLAALMVNRLRQSRMTVNRSSGIPRYELEGMLGEEDAKKPGPLLANAIGFDWRPGIAIDGLVSLALLGNASRGKPGRGAKRV